MHQVLHLRMPQAITPIARAFKTRQFSKAAKKAAIADEDLCEAIQQVMRGQAEDLGGGVFKKRLNKNQHRAIILAKGGKHWIYEYLFAKKDRDNIKDDELTAFKELAESYAKLSAPQLAQLLLDKHFVEICHAQKHQVQE